MVERQRRVDRLALLDPEHLGEADAAHREAQVPDDGRLRVAGRARGVDVEEHVAAADVGDVGLGRRRRPHVVAASGRPAAARRPRARRPGSATVVARPRRRRAPRGRCASQTPMRAPDARSTWVSPAPVTCVLMSAPIGAELRDGAERDQEERAVGTEDRRPARPAAARRVRAPRRGGSPARRTRRR